MGCCSSTEQPPRHDVPTRYSPRQHDVFDSYQRQSQNHNRPSYASSSYGNRAEVSQNPDNCTPPLFAQQRTNLTSTKTLVTPSIDLSQPSSSQLYSLRRTPYPNYIPSPPPQVPAAKHTTTSTYGPKQSQHPPLRSAFTTSTTAIHIPTPQCLVCRLPGTLAYTRHDNPNFNAGRPKYSCGSCGEFLCFADGRGLSPDNPLCQCRQPSRRQVTEREKGRRLFYKCGAGRCLFYAWDRRDTSRMAQLEGLNVEDLLAGMARSGEI